MDRVAKQGAVTLVRDGDHSYTVTDQGRGFPDTPEELAMRFSLDKAMASTKQWRMPTRGCVGNGLRVIVGSVVGSGRIIVKTRNQQVTLRPRLDGTTAVEDVQVIDWPVGTAVTIEVSSKYPHRSDTLDWAELAIILARNSGPAFSRNPSAWWYDRDHLALNMLSAIGPSYTLRDFVSRLDRCSARTIQAAVTDKFGKGRLCRDVNQAQASELLAMLRENDLAVIKPKQLGPMGEKAWEHEFLFDGYACEEGTLISGWDPSAKIPFLVEAWAATCETPSEADDDDVYPANIIGFTINRSPAIVDSEAGRIGRRRDSWINLAGEEWDLSLPLGAFDFALNITSPYVPIVSDNKSPTLGAFKETVVAAVERAVRRARNNNPPELISRGGDSDDEDESGLAKSAKKESQRKRVLDILAAGSAVADASGNGALPFNERALMYVIRVPVPGLTKGYFAQLVTEYERTILMDEIPGMFRSNRGAFYEPHSDKVIPLGTLTVRDYRRDPWIYGTVLVCEKEDNVHMLRAAGFAERWDCFLMSSSGFTTRALKDLIDYIGSTASRDPVRIFAITDADLSGPLIFQTLVQETKARDARNIEIINLGLFPWEALAGGLQHETGLRELARKKSRNGKERQSKVADCILERDRKNLRTGNPNNEPVWAEWLKDNRVELNAMTSRQRVAWVEKKFTEHKVTKVIPTERIAKERLAESLLNKITNQVQEELLRNQQEWVDQQIRERVGRVKIPAGIAGKAKHYLRSNPSERWTSAIDDLAEQLIPEDQRPSE
jgi:hypothetical protein